MNPYENVNPARQWLFEHPGVVILFTILWMGTRLASAPRMQVRRMSKRWGSWTRRGGVVQASMNLLKGIHPDAAELLKDKNICPKALRLFRRVNGNRQIEMAEMMVMMNNYVAGYVDEYLITHAQPCKTPWPQRDYAVTSYGSQGKTVDYVLFSDSTIKAATNAQQWYVSISRGRRGIRIFTPDKEQLRENIRRTGHRLLAMEFADGSVLHGRAQLWKKLHGYLLRFGRRAADYMCRLKLARHHQPKHKYEHKNTRMLCQRPERRGITH
jgi:hypothetical protein